MKNALLYPLLLILTIGIVYALTLRGVMGNPTPETIVNDLILRGLPFESSLASGRFAQTMAIAEDRTFHLTNGKELIATPDLGYYDGRFYSLFPPGISILSVPAYILGQSINASQITVFAFLALIATLNGLLIYAISRMLKAPKWASFFAAIAFNLGTAAWPYAITIAQHNTTVLLLLTTFLGGLIARKHWSGFALGWTAFAAALFVDYINALIFIPAVIFMSLQALNINQKDPNKLKLKLRLGLVYGILPFLLIGLSFGYYNWKNFNSPTTLGNSVLERVHNQQDIQELQLQQKQDSEAQETFNVTGFFNAKNIPNGLYVLLVSRGRGILLYAPIVLIGFIGLLKLTNQHKTFSIALTTTVALNIILYSSFGDPWGGWAFGPRYLIPSMAMLSIGLAQVLKHNQKHTRFLALIWITFIYSAAVNMLGALTTNQLPAEIEAIPLGFPYTYLLNLDLLIEGKSFGFLFANFISNYLKAWQFGVLLFSYLVTISYTLLFYLPNIEKNKRT